MDQPSGNADTGRVDQSGDEFAPSTSGGNDTDSRNHPGWTTGEDGRPTFIPPRGRAGLDAGRRDRGLTEEEANRAAQRPPHEQIVSFNDKRVIDFQGVQFVAHLGADAKFTRQGDLVVTLHVPFEFKHLAFPLTNAFGIPLSVDIQVWKPYVDFEDMTNGRMGAYGK